MNRKTLRLAALPVAAMLALGVAACGGDDDSGSDTGNGAAAEVSGNLAGAGSSAQGAAMQAWIAGFSAKAPDAEVTYDPTGSGAGRKQFTSGGTQFAGSDAYLKPEEVTAATSTCGGGYIEFPGYISPIAVAYNLPGVEKLNLSASVLAKIFDGKITKWNDPAIAQLNSGATLPATNITTVHRSDESGTTENFVDYLAKAAPQDWPYEVDGNWPAKGGEGAGQTQGVAAALRGGEGTIGYIDASQVGDLGVAAIQVGEKFVEYSPEAAAAVVDAAEKVSGRGEFSYAIDLPRDTKADGVYPIVLVSYQLACTSYDSQQTADLVKSFFSYLVSEEGQQAAAKNAGSAPISDKLRGEAQKAIDAIKVKG
ncbi:phosphate ABC transporter substrate-binding protein PstS [Micromonospora endolithica]|uniref:Phosphate-binding protein n=1 Tax=Micromonospora endolithica TaxID=230091 RepID=A0A3A9YSP9_9ACTN|nr:phosphate ABC transporter substrate-binding protein PstS [Micromonospora endolithica]RKN39092.1 phosphate ABC transporter substrate-binding protein PstS [Micromonospora endolithica]TWJ25589.1 phosphate transport system substrate-binding protein [Micromonospora endolithica]